MSFKLKALNIDFLHSIKLPGYKFGKKFDKDPLAVERNTYLTGIENAYTACDLEHWRIISPRHNQQCMTQLTLINLDLDK